MKESCTCIVVCLERKREKNLRVKHCDGTECEVIVMYRVSGTVCEASLCRKSRIRVRRLEFLDLLNIHELSTSFIEYLYLA